MKKIFVAIFVFTYMLFLFPINANAQTIHDYKIELDALEEKERQSQQSIKLTNAQIEKIVLEIDNIYVELANIVKEATAKEKEIIELGIEIDKKDVEIKKIMSAYQISNKDLFYLEYLFGATSITDFIIRYSITEQLTRYNNELITLMNENIETNIRIKKELAESEKQLKQKQITLEVKEKSLRNSSKELEDVYISVLDEIANARETIKMYEDAGCGEYEDLRSCAVKLIPPDTGFSLPLSFGYITSWYNPVLRTIYNKDGSIFLSRPHFGIDMSNSERTGSKVYAAANGKVVYSGYISSGGNYICIHHNIKGIGYTSCYAHLSVRNVRSGDFVTKNTIIGLMGNTGTDTTGPHVHFSIGKGLKYTDNSYAYINPTSVMTVPSSWRSR
jgi:murein DD-endopeptidase MepM/ murein hydrolase activator NlpD